MESFQITIKAKPPPNTWKVIEAKIMAVSGPWPPGDNHVERPVFLLSVCEDFVLQEGAGASTQPFIFNVTWPVVAYNLLISTCPVFFFPSASYWQTRIWPRYSIYRWCIVLLFYNVAELSILAEKHFNLFLPSIEQNEVVWDAFTVGGLLVCPGRVSHMALLSDPHYKPPPHSSWLGFSHNWVWNVYAFPGHVLKS